MYDGNTKEDTDDQEADEAIYCEGICKSWVHRKCAGLSNIVYIYCMLFEQLSLITELTIDIEGLKANMLNLHRILL